MLAPVAACLVLAAGIGAAIAATPERLVAAFLAGDRLELGRTGWNLGAGGLADELVSADRERSLAALAAAPHAEDGHALLMPLSEIARSPDRPRAVAAARAAEAIARELDRGRARELDIPAELLADAAGAWRAIAADPGRWVDVRIDALDASLALAGAAGTRSDEELDSLLADDDPEIRRAALERWPQPLDDERRALAGERARSDPEDDVAATALQALCGGIAAGDAPSRILDALADDGMARLRALLSGAPDGVSEAALVDAAMCAASAADDESRRALSQFRGRLDDATGAILDARLERLE